jgi:hypothetical protein
LQREGLLKEISFAFEAEDSVLGVGTFGSNKADSGSEFELGGVEVLAVGSIEGVGHAEDTCEVLQGLLSLFG